MLLDERQIKFCSLRKQYLSSKNLFCGKPKNCIFRRHIFSEKDKSNSRCETCDMVNIPFWITRHGSACINSIGESRRKDNMQWKSQELRGYGAEMLSTECNWDGNEWQRQEKKWYGFVTLSTDSKSSRSAWTDTKR